MSIEQAISRRTDKRWGIKGFRMTTTKTMRTTTTVASQL